MEIYIGIYDSDVVYARRLMAGLLASAKIKCHTVEFTRPENIKAFAENHFLELVLISKEAYYPELKSERVGKIIGLCEERPTTGELAWAEEQGIDLLLKYQSINVLGKEILGKGGSNTEILEKQMIAVYSPVHRCGKTLFSLAIAQILGEKQPVLLVSMDEFSAVSSCICPDEKYNVMDAMYYYLQGEIKEKEKRLIHSWGNVDMLVPSRGSDDIRGISSEEFMGMIGYFLSDSIYSAVVVDIGDLSDISKLLTKFDSVYMPVLRDSISEEKITAFREYISGKGAMLNDRIKEVELPEVNWKDIAGDYGPEFDEKYRISVRSYLNGEGQYAGR